MRSRLDPSGEFLGLGSAALGGGQPVRANWRPLAGQIQSRTLTSSDWARALRTACGWRRHRRPPSLSWSRWSITPPAPPPLTTMSAPLFAGRCSLGGCVGAATALRALASPPPLANPYPLSPARTLPAHTRHGRAVARGTRLGGRALWPPPVMWHVFRDGAGWGSGGGWAVGEAGRGDTVFVEWGRQPF